MSNYNETRAEILNYLRARTPLIIIETSERERAQRLLSSVAKELSTEIYYYTDTTQVKKLNTSSSERIDVSDDPLAYISSLFVKKHKTIFCYADVSKISEDTIYSREIINILYSAVSGNSTLILITNDPVYSRIAQFGMIAKLDYPDTVERAALIYDFISEYKSMYSIEWDKEDVVKAATLLSGFSEIQINNILSHELVANEGLFKKDIQNLTAQKNKLYGSVANVQYVKVKSDLKVAGLENLKSWVDEKKKIFFATDEQLQSYGLTAPKGILLAGVPGCGKSFSAKLISNSFGLPLFRFDIGSIYDKWMGESERKMKEALDFIDNVAPCVLWVDEIEKALSVSNGENDTGQRILGQFLFWLQESTSRVFLVATANAIDKLPPELFRKGRFSEIFFVDLPNEVERREVISNYVRECLHITLTEEQMAELIEISKGFSFSEIEYAIKETAQILFLYGTKAVDMQVFRDKFASVVPIEKSRAQEVERIREWGKEKAVPATRL